MHTSFEVNLYQSTTGRLYLSCDEENFFDVTHGASFMVDSQMLADGKSLAYEQCAKPEGRIHRIALWSSREFYITFSTCNDTALGYINILPLER